MPSRRDAVWSPSWCVVQSAVCAKVAMWVRACSCSVSVGRATHTTRSTHTSYTPYTTSTPHPLITHIHPPRSVYSPHARYTHIPHTPHRLHTHHTLPHTSYTPYTASTPHHVHSSHTFIHHPSPMLAYTQIWDGMLLVTYLGYTSVFDQIQQTYPMPYNALRCLTKFNQSIQPS